MNVCFHDKRVSEFVSSLMWKRLQEILQKRSLFFSLTIFSVLLIRRAVKTSIHGSSTWQICTFSIEALVHVFLDVVDLLLLIEGLVHVFLDVVDLLLLIEAFVLVLLDVDLLLLTDVL